LTLSEAYRGGSQQDETIERFHKHYFGVMLQEKKRLI
jgi:hypothetical protein